MKHTLINLIIPCSKTYEIVSLSDILRFEALQNYTKIKIADGSCILSSVNIGMYNKILSNYDFFATHKSHLINTTKIKRYHKDGQVELIDQSMVPVSRRRKEAFIKEVLHKGEHISIDSLH